MLRGGALEITPPPTIILVQLSLFRCYSRGITVRQSVAISK